MSAIEVLKDFRFDGTERKALISYSDSEDLPVLIHKDLREALDEALLALEINESLINDLLLLANIRADDTITGNEIISCLLKNKVNIVQGKDFIWERVGEEK